VTEAATHGAPIVNVPEPVEESPVTAGFAACTVKPVEPLGVSAVVVIVTVDVRDVSAAAKFTVDGLKAAVAPDGSAVVRPRFALNAVPVAPFRLTVTTNVALPAVPDVSSPVWEPTVTVPTRFTTSSVAEPEVGPLPLQPLPWVPLTVIVDDVGGTTPLVLISSVRDTVSPPAPLTLLLGVKDAVAPAGSPLADRVTVQAVLFPLKETLTV
jgi:hypothetical protein